MRLSTLRCLSQILSEKNSTVDDVIIAYLFVVEWVGIYKEKLWLLSLLDSHWVRSFLFLIMNRLLRDNGGGVIMQDYSFLIRGARIMETRCFSLLHEFLGRLYCLICKTRENSNFWKNGKIVISVKIRNFFLDLG